MSIPIFLQVFSIIALVVMLCVIMQMDVSPASTYFYMLNTAVLLIMLGYLFELSVPQADNMFLMRALQMLGAVFAYPLFLGCVCTYARIPLPRHSPLLFLALPALVVIPLLLTYAQTVVYINWAAYPAGGPVEMAVYLLCYGYPALCQTAGGWILIGRAIRPRGNSRGVVLLLSFLSVLPQLGVLLFNSGLLGIFNPYSMLLGLSCIVAGILTMQYRVRNWVSTARNLALKNSPDGYLLVDNRHRYIESNDFAKKLFPELSAVFHTTALANFPEVERLVAVAGQAEAGESGLLDYKGLQLQISGQPVEYGLSKVGRVIQVRDVSQLHAMQNRVEALTPLDEETGYYTLRAFTSNAARDFAICKNNGRLASVLAVAIDGPDDVPGRKADVPPTALVRGLCVCMEKAMATTDLIGRDGRLFLVFMTDVGLESAMCRAEYLRREAESGLADENNQPATLSVGIATLNSARHPDVHALLLDAQGALYAAQSMGGNHCSVAGGVRVKQKTQV